MKHGSALQKTALGLGLLLLAAMVAACTGTPVITSSSVAPASTLLPAPQDSSNTLFGIIATRGRWVVKPQFQGASGFSEGLAAVKLGGKWGYVDDNGTVVIPPQFTEAHLFENGIARVATGPSPGPDDSPGLRTASGYGFIEKTGKIVIPATWDDAGDFSAGLAPVMKGSVCGFINTKGTLVIPLQFDATLSRMLK